mgnify:FL=1
MGIFPAISPIRSHMTGKRMYFLFLPRLELIVQSLVSELILQVWRKLKTFSNLTNQRIRCMKNIFAGLIIALIVGYSYAQKSPTKFNGQRCHA